MSHHKIVIQKPIMIEDPVEMEFNRLEREFHSTSYFWREHMPKTIQSSIRESKKITTDNHSKSTYSKALDFINVSSVNWKNQYAVNSIFGQPTFKQYPDIKKSYKYAAYIDLSIFKQYLFNNEYFAFKDMPEDELNQYLNLSVMNKDMAVKLDFFKSDNKLHIMRKTFTKKKDDSFDEDYYFDENMPSIIDYTSKTEITKYNSYSEAKSHMVLQYYTKLGLWVKTIVNPDPNRIIPAIVVKDLNEEVKEVHCYYKNKYIKPELIAEIKPSMLKDKFELPDYFDKRDSELLDMLAI